MKPPPHKTAPVHRSLGGGGSLFCGLKTCLPRRSQTKAGAFPARHLVHRSSATRNEVGSLSDGGSLPCRAVAGRRREPFLSRRSRTKAGAFASVAEIIGKFAGADQLPSPIFQ